MHDIIKKGNGTEVLVLLHGRGATANDLLPFAEQLGWRGDIIALQAPHNTWYPRPFMQAIEMNEPFLSKAVERIAHEIKNYDPRRIVFAGFSQGACLATYFVSQKPAQYHAVLAFSGGLPGKEHEVHVQGDLKGTHVFLGCAENDPYIPADRVKKTAELLEVAGAQVIEKLYPDSMHTIREDEIRIAKEVLSANLKSNI